MSLFMKARLIFFKLLMLFIISETTYAQQEWGDGEIKDVEIEIVKDRVITLPHANRLYEKVPPRPAEPIKPEIKYSFKAFNFTTPELSPIIRPLRLKQEESSQAYRGFVSGGLGNYASSYLEGFVTSIENKKRLLGAHAFLNNSAKGPVDAKNSGSGHMGLSAFAQTFSKEISFNGNVGLENRNTHFYGYPKEMDVKRDTIKQAYTTFNLGLGLANARNADFSYKLGGNFTYLSDKFNAAETGVDLNFKSAYKISEDQLIHLQADYNILSRKDKGIDAKPRNLFQINGYYTFFPTEELKLHIGATVAFESDTLLDKSAHFYPDVRVTYPLNDAIDFVASLTGGIEKVSLHSLSNENLWLAPAVLLSHTNKTMDLMAGVRARLGGKVLVGAGMSLATLKNLYFFVNDPSDASKFQVVYDDGTTKRLNLYASLLYTYSDIFKLSIQGDYFTYGTDEISEAWHKPGFKMATSASYNLVKKILFTVDVLSQGNMKARDPETANKTITLDNAFDVNFKTEYLVSDTFSVFVEFNNITGNKYPAFLNYPVRGFQAMAGVTWKF
jgi:hypothetical protein